MSELHDTNREYHLEQLGMFRETLDRVESSLLAHVKQAKLGGATWQQIADKLGVTRQAAHTRWARKVEK